MAAVWLEVWEESTASAGAGLRLHASEVIKVSVHVRPVRLAAFARARRGRLIQLMHACRVLRGPQLVIDGLRSGQWSRKKAAAAAAAQICKSGPDALAPHAPALLDALLKASRHAARLGTLPCLPQRCMPRC